MKSKVLTVPSSEQVASLASLGEKLSMFDGHVHIKIGAHVIFFGQCQA
jgi:hypothetical protein